MHAEDYEGALRFFRDVLGCPSRRRTPVTAAPGHHPGAGRATMEIANTAQADMIDDVEVGRRVAGQFRVALEVDDCAAASEQAAGGGAVPVARRPARRGTPSTPGSTRRRGAPDAVPGAGLKVD